MVQETFIKVMKSLHTYRGDGLIQAWLYRIGYGEAITATRKRREVPIDPEEMLRSGHRTMPSVEHSVLATELVQTLDHAIAQLSDPLRATFTLRDIEGLCTTEVAEILDVSESAVPGQGSRGAARPAQGVPVNSLTCDQLDVLLPEFLDGKLHPD